MRKLQVLNLLDKDITVGDVIPLLKASSTTYYNLGDKAKESFKTDFNKLKSKSDNVVSSTSKLRIKQILNNETLVSDYLYKYKTIEVLLMQ
jgi:hypothetical protein